MIMLLLGLIDILMAIIAVLLGYGIYFKAVVLIASLYLIVKGAIFIKSVASMIDIAAGLLILLALFVKLPLIILLVIAIYLFQKGIFSIL